MQPSSEKPGNDRSRALRRFGPVAVIVVIVLVIVVVAVTRGGGGGGNSAGDSSGGGAAAPKDAISFQEAQDKNLKVTFPDTCDQQRGTVAIPYSLAPPCYANVADNGGATYKGVTADSITVVVYQAQENDGVLKFITSAINVNDTNEQARQTYQGYVDLFNRYYQTYGRKVDLKFLEASGISTDAVTAKADAIKADEELGAFAVMGGPILTPAFADELAFRKVLCIACELGSPPDFYNERAPYLTTSPMNTDEVQLQTVEYISKRLSEKPAQFAGDPALQGQQRKFGYLWIENNETAKNQADKFASRLDEKGVKIAENIPYTLDPARLQEQATTLITRLKQAGVTTVIFSGDPIAPATFTKEATAQNYFPEWVLGPNALVDTTAFARTYDQQQWAHAFGPSQLTARIDPTQVSAYRLFQWFKGTPPPAVDTNQVIFPNPALLFSGIQSAGPDLTPEDFTAGLFAAEPTPQSLTQPSLSWGEHDRWPYVDRNGVDDMTEIWYDANATGPDEIRKEGKGMYSYSEGGKRFLLGQWTADLKVFDPQGAVTVYAQPPPADAPTDYPSPAGSG